jgi:hypothetical protein
MSFKEMIKHFKATKKHELEAIRTICLHCRNSKPYPHIWHYQLYFLCPKCGAQYSTGILIMPITKQILEESKNPHTTPQRLTEIFNVCYDRFLAYDKSEVITEVLSNLQKNPNTPLPHLKDLADFFPSEFLNNIALDLHLLRNPALLHELTDTALLQLAGLNELPRDFVYSILNYLDGKKYLRDIHAEIYCTLAECHPSKIHEYVTVRCNYRRIGIRDCHIDGFDFTQFDFTNFTFEKCEFGECQFKNMSIDIMGDNSFRDCILINCEIKPSFYKRQLLSNIKLKDCIMSVS